MNNLRKITLAIVIISAGIFSSCNNCIKGEGEPIIRTLEIDSFNAIHLSSSQGVTLSQGVEQKIEIKAPENIIELLNTSVKNNIWEISFQECVKAGTIEINITTPTIEAITITGSGSVKSLNNLNVNQMSISVSGSGNADLMLNAQEISTNISGSGNVKLNGSATNHKANVVGSGDIKASDFITVETKITITGSGDASVHATKLIEASIVGSGDIEYKDTGAKVITEITGSGDIVKK
ncbi:MAG: DUF2807 domain-containing protein [Bacteroidota bacterium]|nr:DUF2807 domain-containing protein [Bacteroidota bacterium]